MKKNLICEFTIINKNTETVYGPFTIPVEELNCYQLGRKVFELTIEKISWANLMQCTSIDSRIIGNNLDDLIDTYHRNVFTIVKNLIVNKRKNIDVSV